MTYGEQQEAACAALLLLLNGPAGRRRLEDVGTILACRHQVHLALLDRLTELGVHRHLERPRSPNRRANAARYPLHLLLALMRAMPATRVDDRPPSALLIGPPVDSTGTTVDLWRAAGRHLMLGNADLTHTLDQTWREGPRWWYLIGDLANTVEALVVLDQALAYAGHLPLSPPQSYLEARLAAGDVARVAGWRGTDPKADLASVPTWSERRRGAEPHIHLVRNPEDFTVAQRTLAGFMQPRHRDDLVPDLDERPGLLAARTLAAGQVRLAEAFATWAEHAGAEHLAERFRGRIPKYIELHRSTLRMVELHKTRTPLVVLQQSELVQQLRSRRAPRLSASDVHELDAATHEVAVNTGKTLRREGMARKNILILDTNRIGPPGARPITHSRDRFTVACRDLASEPTSEDLAHEGDSEDVSQSVRQGNRFRLTRTLDRLDTARRSSGRTL